MWYDRPFFGGIKKLSPSCEPKEIGVQQKFNTDKFGFIYSLGDIRNYQENGLLHVPSMLYLNNQLENCTVNYIKIEAAKHLGRTGQQVAWSRFGPQIFSEISCSIRNLQGFVQFNFSTEYDLVPPTATKRYDIADGGGDKWIYAAQRNLYRFVISNHTKDPAMWWVESLMSFGWLDTALKMEAASGAEGYEKAKQWQSGSINFWPSGNTSDILSDSFFVRNWYMLQDGGSLFYSGQGSPPLLTKQKDPLNQMISSANLLVRSFNSSISADPGVVLGSSILTDETALQKFTSNYTEIAKAFGLVPAGPASDSYAVLKAKNGRPNVTPSKIYATYLCQTPQSKLPTTLILSVLLADLVLLRALRSIITQVAEYLAKRRDPRANQCLGCLDYKDIPLSD